jgi:hypothetical protein
MNLRIKFRKFTKLSYDLLLHEHQTLRSARQSHIRTNYKIHTNLYLFRTRLKSWKKKTDEWVARKLDFFDSRLWNWFWLQQSNTGFLMKSTPGPREQHKILQVYTRYARACVRREGGRGQQDSPRTPQFPLPRKATSKRSIAWWVLGSSLQLQTNGQETFSEFLKKREHI